MGINSYNIGEKYVFTSKDKNDPITEVEVVDHAFGNDRHIWFRYTDKMDKYPIVNKSRGNDNEFILSPRLSDMVMTKKED